ncbi:hypothetical protein ACFL6S_31715 [Candidatus Poribacteria bacterium]
MKNRISYLSAVFSVSVFCSLFSVLCNAATYYVAATGNDSNPGTQTAPFRNIQKGAETIRGGDTMVIRAGTYYEQPRFSSRGSSATQPITIRAEDPGTVTVSGMWREAALGQVAWRDEGDGIYSISHADIPKFAAYESTFLHRYLLDDLKRGIADTTNAKVNLLRHGFAYENGRVYVRLPQDRNPNGQPVLLSASSDWGEWIIAFTNTPYVTIEGLRLEGAGSAGVRYDESSHHATIRNTVFAYCQVGAKLSHDSLIEWSEYLYPGFSDFSEQLRARNNNMYRTYALSKDYTNEFSYEGAIATASHSPLSPTGCEFRYNYIHDAFDGEKLGVFQDSESHHNLYENNYDNHVELEHYGGDRGPSSNLRLHHNLFRGVSNAPISHQAAGIKGPQYVYRNVVIYDIPKLNKMGYSGNRVIKIDMPKENAGIFYYHNTILGDNRQLLQTNRPGGKYFTFRNNVLIFANTSTRDTSYDSDYNLLVNIKDILLMRGDNGKYLGSESSALQFIDGGALNYGIQAGSPAQNVGVSLAGFNDDAPGGPDVGAFEVGDFSGPDWPRARTSQQGYGSSDD